MDQLLKLVFPTIYGQGSQQDSTADQIFKRVVQFLRKDQIFFTSQQEKTFLLDRLTRASPSSPEGSIKIIFKCQYACSIVIKKRTQESDFLIQIIAPEQWGSGTHNWEMINMDFCQPKDKKTHYMPQVDQSHHTIESFFRYFNETLIRALEALRSPRIPSGQQSVPQEAEPVQFSPKTIHRACKLVSEMSHFSSSFATKQKDQNQAQGQNSINKKQVQTGVQSINLNKSHADTCWYVPEATIKDLIKRHSACSMNSSIEKLIICFKGHLLQQVTKAKASERKYDQMEVLNFKKCLDELIQKYKQHISIEKQSIANQIEDFTEFIQRVQQNLKIITNNGLTSKINDIDQIIGGLPFQKQSSAATINCINQIKHNPQKIVLATINDYPLSVDQRLPFQKLLEIGANIILKDFEEQSKWILLTQRTFFSLTSQFVNDKPIIDLMIHLRQIECQKGANNLSLIVQKYEQVIKTNSLNFGMGMQGQSKSHIQLIKCIAAIVAFESVKMNRQMKRSNLKDYRVPLNIDTLYKGFVSHSYQARQAMKNILKYYNYHKDKKPIFVLNGKSNTFQQFARLAAQQTRTVTIWSNNKKKQIELMRQNAYLKIKLQQANQIKENIIKNFPYDRSSYLSIEHYRAQTINLYQTSIITQYNQKDPNLFAFLQNIPIDILGLIKILYLAQNAQTNVMKQDNNLFNQHFVDQKLSIKIYSKRPNQSKQYISSGGVQQKGIPINNAFQPVKILFNNSSFGTDLNTNIFQNYNDLYEQQTKNNLFKSKLQYLLKRPIDQKIKDRQHRLYARQNDKPQQIQIDDFLAMGNVRSAQNTQLMILCSNIYKRNIISNSYDNKCKLAEQLILQTAGQLSIYNPKIQKQFKQIKNLIQQFINVWSFTDVNFCPLLAPFLGFIGRQLVDDQLIPQINDIKKSILQICKKCFDEYKRGENQLDKMKQNEIQNNNQKQKQKEKQHESHGNIQWNQRFVITAAVICFRQLILTIEDKQEIQLLCSLIFQLRSCQILSGRQKKPQGKRQFQDQLQFSIYKTIFYNIQVISQYLNQNPQTIAQIVKRMDPSYIDNFYWSRNNIFSFIGQSNNKIKKRFNKKDPIYQIDLFSGKIFKDGKQISALDPVIKENPYFKQIFGQKRQFQVFQQGDFYKTKKTLTSQFKLLNRKGQIYFEFSKDGKEIKYIYQTKDRNGQIYQQEWVLVPRQILRQSDCHIPKIFLDHYIAWYCDQKRCMMFRSNSFEQIYNVGMVIHVKKVGRVMNIQKAFHITYHGSFEDQQLDKLCHKKSTKYDEIILRKKSTPLQSINCFKLLNKFESPQYILELKNTKHKDQTKIQYFLPRYQSKFFIQDQTRLSSQTYFGYSLDHSFYNQENSKNSIFNKFSSCLVLQKHSDNQALLNNHKRIVIISDGQIQLGGNIKKPKQANKQINSFKYQLHDFFGDIRGTSRQSIIHLSGLMLSINDNIKISSLQMTPLDYSIYLLNSCMTNRPYSLYETKKIINITKLNPPQTIVLLIQCLWNCSKSLKQVLFSPPEQQKQLIGQLNITSNSKKNKKKRSRQQIQNDYLLNHAFQQLEQKLMNCRTLYSANISKQLVRYRQKINIDFLNFIGLDISNGKVLKLKQQKKQDNDKKKKNNRFSKLLSVQSNCQQNQKVELKYWKNFPILTGNIYEKQMQQIDNKFKQFTILSSKISQIWINNKQNNKSNYSNLHNNMHELPQQIRKTISHQKKNPMAQQLLDQLSNSYDTFLNQQARIELVMQKLIPKKQSQKQIIKKLIRNASQIIQLIQTLIHDIKQLNQIHPDVVTGIIPTLSPICFTKILCYQNTIKDFFPHLKPNIEQGLLNIIKIWIQLKTRISSFERIQILLNTPAIDTISLMRQAQSPRQQIRKKNHWLCFQAQNKVQLWSSQLKTFQNLSRTGDFCQLNMGQGKTQVIIPMMILDSIFLQDKYLPRINLLSSLIDQARRNFFRFLSVTGFQISGFELPFNRNVKLIKNIIKNKQKRPKQQKLDMSDINKVRNLIDCFSSRLYILMTRQSRLSQILRFYQQNRNDSNVSMSKCPLIPQKLKVYDIFDQIDQVMNPLKSYIFSIGDTKQLPSSKQRFQIIRVVIERFLKTYLKTLLQNNTVISQQTHKQTLRLVKQGQYPPGLRLNFTNLTPQNIMKFRKNLAKNVIRQFRQNYFSFYKKLKKDQQQILVEYIINPFNTDIEMPKFVQQPWKEQILVLRGALGYGIFQHCLSMRCGVDYGVPNKQHRKKIAVPYQAADIPSKTSQYQHPDVSILLSYFAYYTKGLTEQQFNQVIDKLLNLSDTSRLLQYNLWYQTLSKLAKKKCTISNAQQINRNSIANKKQLYTTFRRNRKTIAFWLNNCIFPSNLRQYKQSITSSAWDLADVDKCVGFSGTKDNRWLYSDKLNYKPCQTAAIKGTDGKMIHLISKHTKQICLIKQSKQSQWQRFIDTALNKNVGCIIDAGALCVGKSLQKQIVPWIAQHQNFNHQQYVGISFCDETGKWKVFKTQQKHYIPRGTSIPDHKTFVIFDEARTRGADLKMSSDVVAAISLGPKMTKDKFMQAAGRLRRLGRSQQLIIMATHQIFELIPQFKGEKYLQDIIHNMEAQQLSNMILGWCCKNSIQLNQKLLIQYANLGWDYIRSKYSQSVYVKDIFSRLEQMYETCLIKTTVDKLNDKTVQKLNYQNQKFTQSPSGQQIIRKLQLYGSNVQRQGSNVDDVCQREVEKQPQPQVIKQDAVTQLLPIAQKDNAIECDKMKQVAIKFNQKFKISQNFIQTTRNLQISVSLQARRKQLSELYFLLMNENTIKAITLRQASMFINKYVIDDNKDTNYKIVFLDNLSIQDEYIKTNKLQSALISAKYLSGVYNYKQQQQDYLLTILMNSLQQNKQKWNKANNDIKSNKQNEQRIRTKRYDQLVSIVLTLKRVRGKKYIGSTLQKMVIRLQNQDYQGRDNQQITKQQYTLQQIKQYSTDLSDQENGSQQQIDQYNNKNEEDQGQSLNSVQSQRQQSVNGQQDVNEMHEKRSQTQEKQNQKIN